MVRIVKLPRTGPREDLSPVQRQMLIGLEEEIRRWAPLELLPWRTDLFEGIPERSMQGNMESLERRKLIRRFRRKGYVTHVALTVAGKMVVEDLKYGD